MSDLFGFTPQPARPFKDIRNTRDPVAERKAQLCFEIAETTRSAPAAVANGSIQLVRRWRAAAEKAKAVASNRRSSVEDLSRALKELKGCAK